MPCGVRCKSLSFAVCGVGADSVESADSTESRARLKIEDPWEISSRNLQSSIRPPIQLNGADSTESDGPNPLSRRPIIYLIDRVYIHKMKRSPRRSEKSPMKM